MKFTAVFFIIIITLSGCLAALTTELVEEHKYIVGSYEIKETIYREDSFPDAQYKRVYAVGNKKIGSYSDESSAGITIPPEMVGEWLAIYSSSHLFLWQPDEEVRQFNPYQADGFIEYSDQFQFGLNGHYEYQVTAFWMENGRWFINYDEQYHQKDHPPTLLFTSDDEGISYTIRTSP